MCYLKLKGRSSYDSGFGKHHTRQADFDHMKLCCLRLKFESCKVFEAYAFHIHQTHSFSDLFSTQIASSFLESLESSLGSKPPTLPIVEHPRTFPAYSYVGRSESVDFSNSCK